MAYLLISQGESQHSFQLPPDRPAIIGRSRDCDVHLDDPSLSRRHCEIRSLRNHWKLKDLASSNGTTCNDLLISEHTLVHGDCIQLGLVSIIFTQTAEEIQAAGGVDDPAVLARRLRNFIALVEIAKAVSGELEQDRLLDLVVVRAIDLAHAERGFLILVQAGQHVFRVARTRDGSTIADPERTVSRSVIASVVQTGEPVLTIDAQNDLSVVSQTIMSLEIRSLLCVPLKAREEVLGCIVVDSQMVEQQFGEEALDLLQAFADQAAIALHNARLYTEAQESREQEKRVRQMFQKYVPADVVRRALELSDQKKMSTKQVATVLFSDIRSFTSISERMEPEDVVCFLNDYLQRMVDIVFDEGGIVDKFIGDAVMAVFGAPFPKPDDALRAVRAAHRMMAELERFNADQALKEGGVHIRIGIGIHTGPVIAGNIGSDRKMEYTVIGDTVNIASRVQDLNKEFKTEIIITQAVWDATRRRVPVRQLGAVTVKGKEIALQVFEALRPGAAPQHSASGPIPGQIPGGVLAPGALPSGHAAAQHARTQAFARHVPPPGQAPVPAPGSPLGPPSGPPLGLDAATLLRRPPPDRSRP